MYCRGRTRRPPVTIVVKCTSTNTRIRIAILRTSSQIQLITTSTTSTDFHADVVISNELIDAFAPVKLKLSVFDLDNVDPGKCSSWTEMKLLHLIKIRDVMGLFARQLGIEDPLRIVKDLQSFTDTFFCTAMQTSVGKAAMEVVPRNTTCMTTVLYGDLARKK